MYKSQQTRQKLLTFADQCFLAIVYDCETTGLDPQECRLIQISARKCVMNPNGLEEIERKCWYINPGIALPEKIVNLTGITDEFLEDKPMESEIIEEVSEFFENLPVIGYNNLAFDDEFMRLLYERYGITFQPEDSIDVYGIARFAIEIGETVNYKLPTITSYFGFDKQIDGFHNAEQDTLALLLCFNKLLEICKNMQPVVYENQIDCSVKRIAYWKSPKNWRISRIYVETDKTNFYYDLFGHAWHTSDINDRTAKYNMEDIVTQVLILTGCNDEDDLAKFKGEVRV